ncbi:hypothetical protein [Streptomyces erythrochromogenes]|uniref:hypothetical protein n=1 Tax=Streptomyces erythrochromogenes TaxID=285574 RepID=UPI00381F33F5
MKTQVRKRTTAGRPGTSARWYSANGTPPPEHVITVVDSISVAQADRLISEGTALLWGGDYPSALTFLTSLDRRAERRHPALAHTHAHAFLLHRRRQERRAGLLCRALVPYEDEGTIPLRRAPRAREACVQAYGPCPGPGVGSLRELLGVISAYEWHRKGVEIPARGRDRIT